MTRFKIGLGPLFAILAGLSLGLLLTFFIGENPFSILKIMARSSFGSAYDFGMTLTYVFPLVLAGLSVAVGFQAGLFNVGAEGQLTVGSFACAAVGVLFPQCPRGWALLLGVGTAFCAGALWGAIPGWLKASRGSHEVINTILLNFIAAGLCSWGTLNWIPSQDTQNLETATIGPGFRLTPYTWFDGAQVTPALWLALFCCLGVGVFLWRTVSGFQLRTVGQNETAALMAGISPGTIKIKAMALAGGLAGLIGVLEVMGCSDRYRVGFSPGYGFTGIAVALLGKSRPLGVLASAILFGVLFRGTSELDLETEHITRDFSFILQALVILFVSADFAGFRKRRRKAVA